MAETQQEAEARIRIEQPEGTVTQQVGADLVTLSGAAYDAWVTDRATLQIAQQVRDEDEAQRKTIRDAAKAQLARMDQIAEFTGSSTNAQRDAAIKDIADFNRKLARILIQRGIIEP